jgi:hypothetical protein
LPSFITQTFAAILRTMPRSWVMNNSDMPSRFWTSFKQLDDLRLHRDVERGGRLVGDEQIGLVGERHGDHHALALAAGQLMRIAPSRLCGSGMPTWVSTRACARARRRRSARDAAAKSRRSASRSCAAD